MCWKRPCGEVSSTRELGWDLHMSFLKGSFLEPGRGPCSAEAPQAGRASLAGDTVVCVRRGAEAIGAVLQDVK